MLTAAAIEPYVYARVSLGISSLEGTVTCNGTAPEKVGEGHCEEIPKVTKQVQMVPDDPVQFAVADGR